MDHRDKAARVKVCGITRVEDALAAVRAGVDALGFVFHPSSPRYITPEKADGIIRALPPFVITVGIFVNLNREEVKKIAAKSGIQVIQLHGNEDPEQCMGYNRPVIKAFRFSASERLPEFVEYQVSGLLIDSASRGQWGGTGIPFDWELLSRCLGCLGENIRHRLVIAGGLDPQNVGEALRLVKPYAVDVSSGVESEPGKKNEKMIKEFMHAVVNAGFAQNVA
jgi:phosphoribosylanthranilate isomerase